MYMKTSDKSKSNNLLINQFIALSVTSNVVIGRILGDTNFVKGLHFFDQMVNNGVHSITFISLGKIELCPCFEKYSEDWYCI